MLDSFREKLQEVQQDLNVVSTSIRKLSVSEPTTPASSGSSRKRAQSSASPKESSKDSSEALKGAGAELLHRYQSQWESLHSKTQACANSSDEAAELIFETSTSLERNFAALSEFESLLSGIFQAEDAFKSVEHDLSLASSQLNLLEKLIDERELRREVEQQDKMQLDARYKLALYKEERVADFEAFKSKCAAEHCNKVKDYERLSQSKLKERQEAFDAAFKEDVSHYKQMGKIEKATHGPSTVALEEIEVEPDPKDKDALDSFLTE